MKRIESKPLIGFLLNPFGTHARSINYENGVVSINARRQQNIQVADLSAPPLVTRGFVGGTLKLTVDQGTQVLLLGANHKDSRSFSDHIKTGWTAHNIAKFNAERLAIHEVLPVITELSQPTRYPSACIVSPTLEQAIFDLIRATASGQVTKSEALGLGDNEFVPWQIGAVM